MCSPIACNCLTWVFIWFWSIDCVNLSSVLFHLNCEFNTRLQYHFSFCSFLFRFLDQPMRMYISSDWHKKLVDWSIKKRCDGIKFNKTTGHITFYSLFFFIPMEKPFVILFWACNWFLAKNTFYYTQVNGDLQTKAIP